MELPERKTRGALSAGRPAQCPRAVGGRSHARGCKWYLDYLCCWLASLIEGVSGPEPIGRWDSY